jgi:hypothetical protein
MALPVCSAISMKWRGERNRSHGLHALSSIVVKLQDASRFHVLDQCSETSALGDHVHRELRLIAIGFEHHAYSPQVLSGFLGKSSRLPVRVCLHIY